MIIRPEFVDFIPDNLEKGVIYISIKYSTAIHICPCGEHEVVTPFSLTDWEMRFYGEYISLYPSIGNWSFSCKSHYWILKNRIVLAKKWTDKQIKYGRKADQHNKDKYFRERKGKDGNIENDSI